MAKAPKVNPLSLSAEEKAARVAAVVDRLLGRSPQNALAGPVPGLDISKPNVHDSKAESDAEVARVNRALAGLRDAVDQLHPGARGKEGHEQSAVSADFRSFIDRSARRRVAGIEPESASDLIRRNNAQVGFFFSSLYCMLDLISALEDRLGELEGQRRLFWTVSSRPPHYFARALALRLARLYAREKGERPTVGKSRDGNYPSTDFGRALEEVFAIVGVDANFRNAAKWAVDELTEADLKKVFETRPALRIRRSVSLPLEMSAKASEG